MKQPVRIALIIVTIIILWILSGVIFPSEQEGDKQIQSSISELDLSKLLEIRTIKPQQYSRILTLYGETEPSRKVAIKAETKGVVKSILAKEGDQLKRGQVILQIDMQDRQAQLIKAKALSDQRRIEYNAARKLQKKGFQSEVRLAETRARLEEAKASLKRIQLDISYTSVRAPFSGSLEKLNAEIGDFVGVGVFGAEGAIAEIVDMNPLIITAQVPQDEVLFLKKDGDMEVHLNDKRIFNGKIKFIANVADNSTRAFRVEGEIKNTENNIPAGIAAELHLNMGSIEAYLIPSSSISLDDKGNVGVKLLNYDNIVIFNEIKILEETDKGLWITGIKGEANLISLAHNFVNEGQDLKDLCFASIDNSCSEKELKTND